MATGLRSWTARMPAIGFFVTLALVATASHALAQLPQQYSSGYINSVFQTPTTWQLFQMRIIPMILAAAVGFAGGAFFSPALKRFRGYALLTLLGVILLYALFGPMPFADGLSYLVAFFIFCAALIAGLKLGAAIGAGSTYRKPTSLGSAQWADLEHLQENGIVGRDGFALGEFVTNGGKDTYPLHYQGERHLLTVAPTRSG